MMENYTADKQLIIAILKQAIVDVLNCPCVSPSAENHYRKNSKQADSAEAKRFLDKEDMQFKYICGLLDYDPDYAERKIWAFIRKEMEFPKHGRTIDELQELPISA